MGGISRLVLPTILGADIVYFFTVIHLRDSIL